MQLPLRMNLQDSSGKRRDGGSGRADRAAVALVLVELWLPC